jgi:metal-sulfur cluster biosynthetic enzyme
VVTAKATPAAADMHAALRDALAQARINAVSTGTSASRKTTSRMMTSKARAARNTRRDGGYEKPFSPGSPQETLTE